MYVKVLISYLSIIFEYKKINSTIILFSATTILLYSINLLTLGTSEVFISTTWSLLFSIIIFNIINIFFHKNLIKRFGLLKKSKKDFYECGFKPQTQKPIKLSIQFLLILIFFLLYDIELLFFFPFISNIAAISFYDFFLFLLFNFFLILSLVIDYYKHSLLWQY